MGSLPVVIRLLDPPLHEFLPKREDLLVQIAKLEATKPVSYTHLDVYKRQGLSSCSSSTRSRIL